MKMKNFISFGVQESINIFWQMHAFIFLFPIKPNLFWLLSGKIYWTWNVEYFDDSSVTYDSGAGKEIPEDGDVQRLILYAGVDHVLRKVEIGELEFFF